MTAKTWGDLLNDVRSAIASGDWDAGETAVAWLNREAEHQATPGTLASAAFYTGMFHDARGALAEAEASFGEAASWDERAHGPESQQLADALRSVAIVQKRRERIDAAVATYERAAAIYRKNGLDAMAAECLRGAGDALRLVLRLDEAFDAYARVLEAIGARTESGLRVERIYALVSQSETMRQGREFETAYTLSCKATREGAPPVDDAIGSALASAWLSIGFLCRHVFRDEPESILAYAMARELAKRQEPAASARKGIAESKMPELAARPIPRGVVSKLGAKGWAGVYHRELGAIVVDDAAGHAVGDRVDVRRIEGEKGLRYAIVAVGPDR